jgi:hypothetical protein
MHWPVVNGVRAGARWGADRPPRALGRSQKEFIRDVRLGIRRRYHLWNPNSNINGQCYHGGCFELPPTTLIRTLFYHALHQAQIERVVFDVEHYISFSGNGAGTKDTQFNENFVNATTSILPMSRSEDPNARVSLSTRDRT